MLKKTITYTDFNNTERTEDFYFNLSTTELSDMENSTPGGLAAKIQEVVTAQDLQSIIKIFKELILKSYGEKSQDGRRFIKSEALSEAFSQTQAFETLFIELAKDEKAASEFVNGIIPAYIAKQLPEKF